MNSHFHRLRNILTVLAVAATLWLALDSSVEAQSAGELTEQGKRGKQIYLKGEASGGEITAQLGTDIELPAASFPCANCHGLRGEGGSEGGLKPPPVNWESLVSPRQSALTRSSRVAYTESTLNRSISMGIDSSGNRLHPGMPRYRMTRAQMNDLVAYLKKIGKDADLDPGIGEESVTIGAALPVTGGLARIGEDIKSALEAAFAATNAQGGIYGRKLALVVEDSGGTAEGTIEATRRLVEQKKVFALVGSFEPAGSEATNDYLRQSQVPLIGPVTLSPMMPIVPNPVVFYLLPSFNDQMRALVDFIASDGMRAKRAAKRIAVVYGESDFDKDALQGVKSQAVIHSIEIVSEQQYKQGRISVAEAVAALAEKKPDYVFFFGGSSDFASFAVEMDRAKLESGLASSTVMAGNGAFQIPPSIASRVYLSYPASLPGKEDFNEFIAIMQKAGVSLRGTAFQAVAFAAARVLAEAVRNSSRQLSRAVLISALENLREFKTGVLPPITFGPNRRVGAAGSYIVGVDAGEKKYIPLSDRIVPKAGAH